MVNGKATAWVKVPLCMAVEDFRLPAFGDFVNRIDDNCGEKGQQKIYLLGYPPHFFLLLSNSELFMIKSLNFS